MWNCLPEYVVNAPSVDSSKNRLAKQWSNDEIVYDYKAAAPAVFQALVACNIVTLAHYSSFVEIATLGYIMAYEEWAQTTIPCCE